VPEHVTVTLRGAVHTIVARAPDGPGAAWTAYAIRLDATAGWVHEGTEQAATTAEIQQVLSSLQQLRIRGEYNEGVEVTGLDNVVFGIEG
jgi:hypothetical protein